MNVLLALIGTALASLSHLIAAAGTIGLIGEVEPPESLLQ